jgi:hypothetical protein
VIGVVLLSAASAQASLTITPTTLTDPSSSGTGSCPNDPCSLREAVNYIHGQGGGTVSLSPPAPQGTFQLTQNTLQVPGGVSIIGPGPEQVTIDLVTGTAHVIEKQQPLSGGPDVIAGVTITGDKQGGIGGGVLSYGGLALNDVNVTGNYGDLGAGVSAEGSLTISDSTITNNIAEVNGVTYENGGGVAIQGNGSVTISDSTIAGNTARLGGGVYVQNTAPVSLENVTIADNTATSSGGAGGNVYNAYSSTNPLQATNTIIAGGFATTAGTENCGGTAPVVGGGAHDLEDRNQCGLTGAGDLVNTNPLLGPLQNNGGVLSTLALGVGSPAINAGTGCVDAASMPLGHDERGVMRPQGPSCDIGAFEFRLPQLDGAPQITGTIAVGDPLTCKPPTTASPDGTPNLSFGWSRDGAPIAGASVQTYMIAASDAGHTLTCAVTATYAATAALGSVSATSTGVSVRARRASVTPAGQPSTSTVNGSVVVAVGANANCPAGGAACTVTVSATANVPSGLAAADVKSKPITIGTASFGLAPGATKHISFKLSRKGAELLAKLRKLKAIVRVTIRPAHASAVTKTLTIIVRAPKHHHP